MAKKIIIQDGILFIGTNDTAYQVLLTIKGSVKLTGTGALTFPVGTSATRPSSPLTADLRYNADITGFEFYNGTLWEPLLSVTGYAVLSGGNHFTDAQSVGFTTLTYSSTITINATTSNNYRVILTGNTLFANPTGFTDGQEVYLLIYQDATGHRLATFGSIFEFVGGNVPVLSTGSNDVDLLYGVYDATQGKFVCDLTSLSGSGLGPTGATGAAGAGGSAVLNFQPPPPFTASANYTPILTDIDNTFIISNDSIGSPGPITITISPHSTTAWPIGCTLQGIQQGIQQVTITPGAGVTINPISTNIVRRKYSVWGMQYLGGDVWQLFGDLL